jgi:hypothetical protein
MARVPQHTRCLSGLSSLVQMTASGTMFYPEKYEHIILTLLGSDAPIGLAAEDMQQAMEKLLIVIEK